MSGKIPGTIPGNFQEISRKFPGIFVEISGKYPGILMDVRDIHIDIVKRQIKISTIGLQEINHEIIPDPPVEYLRKYIFSSIHTPFNYIQ